MTNIVNRAIALIARPKDEWAVIDGETTSTQQLFTGYVIFLAAIPAVMGLISSLFLSAMLAPMMGSLGGLSGLRLGLSPVIGVFSAVIGFVLSLAMVFVLALIIDGLASSFGVEKNRPQAMKVAAYAPTAIWVASLATIVPILGALVVLAAAIYTIFVFHWGLKALMKPPEDKAVGYTAVVLIVGCVVAFVINFVLSIPLGMMTVAAVLANPY